MPIFVLFSWFLFWLLSVCSSTIRVSLDLKIVVDCLTLTKYVVFDKEEDGRFSAEKIDGRIQTYKEHWDTPCFDVYSQNSNSQFVTVVDFVVAELLQNPPEGIVAGPINEENFFEWESLITYVWEISFGAYNATVLNGLLISFLFCLDRGPEGTPFEDGIFVANLSFPSDYPLSPPSMRFVSEIFHPNSKK